MWFFFCLSLIFYIYSKIIVHCLKLKDVWLVLVYTTRQDNVRIMVKLQKGTWNTYDVCLRVSGSSMFLRKHVNVQLLNNPNAFFFPFSFFFSSFLWGEEDVRLSWALTENCPVLFTLDVWLIGGRFCFPFVVCVYFGFRAGPRLDYRGQTAQNSSESRWSQNEASAPFCCLFSFTVI